MRLVLENLCKNFEDSSKNTINNINLTINSGEFVCLLGPSGCGKSTLLNLIAGLDTPTSGRITLDGELVTEPGSERAMMFQESALFPWLNVIDNVKFGMKIAKMPKEYQEERAMYYLEMVHLKQYKDYQIHQLSGGMRQRVALARALTLDSKVLLMDEPFAALDKQTKNLLRDELEKIWLETKKTIVYVTHSVEEAMFFGDKVVMMSANPGTIKKIFEIYFPRPRHVEDSAFVQLRASILKELRNEVLKADEIGY